jgi:hypothetical protein
MDMGEAIGVAIAAQAKDPTCEHEKEEDQGWTSRVNKYNSKGASCTGTRLYEHMLEHKKEHIKKSLGNVPEKVPGKKWSLINVNPEEFPIQAHHLIPKNHLHTHPVTAWLAIKFKKNKKYELLYDSKYDTDHHHNGYCMPYSSPLTEWSGDYNVKFLLSCEVMDRTGIQVHQGSHPLKFDEKDINKKIKVPKLPIKDTEGGADSDKDEMDEIETAGYLDKVDELLEAVHDKVLAHLNTCTDKCKQEKQGKKDLILPLSSVADMMDEVSYILKVLIDSRVIYVSWYAYAHAFKNELIFGDPNKYTLSEDMAKLLKFKLGG